MKNSATKIETKIDRDESRSPRANATIDLPNVTNSRIRGKNVKAITLPFINSIWRQNREFQTEFQTY